MIVMYIQQDTRQVNRCHEFEMNLLIKCLDNRKSVINESFGNPSINFWMFTFLDIVNIEMSLIQCVHCEFVCSLVSHQ